MRVKLRELAHGRTGDKGNTANISVIAYREEDYALLAREVTADRVAALYAPILTGPVRRYEIPSIGALNFVLEGCLGGGVSRNLALDRYGKTLSAAILNLEVDLAPDEVPTLQERAR